MALTDTECRNAKPGPKPYKLFDAGALYLLVMPTGSRLWRWKYRCNGSEKLLALGRYPETKLGAARVARDAAREKLRAGVDPNAERRVPRRSDAPPADRFRTIATEWHARQIPLWAPIHAADVLNSLEDHVFPALGDHRVNDITPPMVLSVLRAIEARPAIETAHRVRQRMSAVFVYAIASGIGQTDPAAIVKGALSPVVRGRQPAITDLDELRAMLRTAEAEIAHPITKAALRFLALTVVRPGELRGARWDEFENLAGDEPIWRIPGDRMKGRLDRKAHGEHVVPLAPEAVALLAALRPFSGRAAFVFPNGRSAHRPLSGNALNYLLYRAGYHALHTPHGFRAAFSSLMNERHPADRDAIEAALAHVVGGVRGAYMRANFLARRRDLMGEWAGLLLAGAVTSEALMLGRRK